MSRYDQTWRDLNRPLSKRVFIINVDPWIEAIALVVAFLAISGLLDLIERLS